MTDFDRMKEILEKQKQKHINDGPLPVSIRKDWIDSSKLSEREPAKH